MTVPGRTDVVAARDERMVRVRDWTSLTIVALAALAAYSNTFSVPFQFDDGESIVGNPAVRDLSAYLSAPWRPLRPLGYLTFALNGSLGGQSLLGYHLFNFAVHLASAALVYFLTLLVARLARPSLEVGLRARVGALIAAALFALHPVQTQAVTYIVQRLASLSALLYVGAVLAYGYAVLDGSDRVRRIPYTLALLLGGSALLVKENAASLPIAIALWDGCFVAGRWRARTLRILPFLALVLAIVLLVLKPWAVMAKLSADYGAVAAGGSRSTYLLTQATVLVTYLRLLVFPVAQNLDYDFPIRTSLLDPAVLRALVLLLLVVGVPALMALRRRARSGFARVLLFAIGWFFVTLSVESSFFPLADVIAEHRLYLPMAGLSVALGCGVAMLIERTGARRPLLYAALAAWLLALGGATWDRNRVWRDPMTLWSDVVSKSPTKSRPLVWLAQEHLARQDYAAAIRLLRRATASPRPIVQAWINLGASLTTIGRPREGAEAYRRALPLLGDDAGGSRDALEQAITTLDAQYATCDHLAAEVRLAPAHAEARQRLAACRMQTGDVASAVAEWERLLHDDPSDAVSAFNAADGHDRMMEPEQAARGFARFLELAGNRFEPQRAHAERWLALHPNPVTMGAP